MHNDAETGLNYNYFRDYNPALGRYIEADPIGLWGGDINYYRYVEGQPVNWVDIFGLAKSGQTVNVGQNQVRVDPPHVPGQQTHAHITGGNIKGQVVVNIDGTPSHGTKCSMPKNKKLLKFLRGKGFQLSVIISILGIASDVSNGESAQKGIQDTISDIMAAPIFGVSEAE